jgi:hypothetical protein
MLGVLPNQLRELLKLQNPVDYDAAFEDFSKELFWSGYKIWRTRKEKMKHFWEYIAPEWWKLHHKDIKNPRKQHEKKIAEQCTRPFHFLRRTINLSGQRPTICTCSVIQQPMSMYKFRDITILNNDPQHIKSIVLSGKKRKSSATHAALNQDTKAISSLSSKNSPFYETRDILIRGAHDKSKRFRVSTR